MALFGLPLPGKKPGKRPEKRPEKRKENEQEKTSVCACDGCPAGGAAENAAAGNCRGNGADGPGCVKVLGSGCKSCHALLQAAQAAVRSMGLGIKVEYVTDLQKSMEYGVMSMPALVVNEQVVSMGRVLKAEEVEELLRGLGL